MKLTYILCASVLILGAPAITSAQAQAQSKSALIDSTNKHLQRGGKPAKSGVTAASLAPQASSKAKRSVDVPAITQPAASPAGSKAARTSAATDSPKVVPPVQRAAHKAKSKPPTQ